MAKYLVIIQYVSLMTLAGIFSAVFADCVIDDLRCCANEFFPLVTAESGFNIEEESLNKSCYVLSPTFQCLNDFEEQCMEVLHEEEKLRIGDLQSYLTDLCSPGSKISDGIEDNRQCIMATSDKLKSCASKKDFQSGNPWSKHCCDYKMLKACAEDTIKENCGDEVRVLVRDMVKKIHGLGYETACKDYYDTCGNSAPIAFATTLMVLIFTLGVIFTNML